MEITHRANKHEAYAEGFKNKDKLSKEIHDKYRRVVERYILLLLLSKQIEEGVEKMFGKIKILRAILKRKNAQIRAEREKYAAERAANAIIAAYLALLVSKRGAVRVPKSEISDALGKFYVSASASGGDYVIEVGELPMSARGREALGGKTGKI